MVVNMFARRASFILKLGSVKKTQFGEVQTFICK